MIKSLGGSGTGEGSGVGVCGGVGCDGGTWGAPGCPCSVAYEVTLNIRMSAKTTLNMDPSYPKQGDNITLQAKHIKLFHISQIEIKRISTSDIRHLAHFFYEVEAV